MPWDSSRRSSSAWTSPPRTWVSCWWRSLSLRRPRAPGRPSGRAPTRRVAAEPRRAGRARYAAGPGRRPRRPGSCDAVSSARDSALAMAVAASSVNSPMRNSVPTGMGLVTTTEAPTITPHSRSSTMIGLPALDRTPISHSRSARGPEHFSKSSIRAGWLVLSTMAATFSPSSRNRDPTGMCELFPLQAATTVAVAVRLVAEHRGDVDRRAACRPPR